MTHAVRLGLSGTVCGLIVLLASGGFAFAQADVAPAAQPVATAPAATAPATVAEAPAATESDAARGGAAAYWLQRCVFVLIVVSVLTGIWLAHRGHVLPSREIPGLRVFDEAVARATEMGRPTLFTVGGSCNLQRVQLFASMPLLREAARLSGDMGNRLMVPVCFPETMPLHVNAVRDGYIDAGAMDAFMAEDVRFFPGDQFFFAIASMGWMLEEQPAACFYFGYWEADSLLFAETGQTIGALQIAGTDSLFQVPFFVASCDYTVIGEEFWAASAKISQDPQLLGSLGAQDLFKLGILILIVAGCILAAFPSVAQFFNDLRAMYA